MKGRLHRASLRSNIVISLSSLLVAGILAITSWYSYEKPELFLNKFADLLLQLGVIVIAGSLVKILIDWATGQRARQRQRYENMLDFMKRVRSMHLEVHYTKDLLNAHRSGKTYVERMKRLILLRGEVVEIIEDLKATESLFEAQKTIIESLEAIVSYISCGRDEYIRCYQQINLDAKAGKPIDETIKNNNMEWLRDLMGGSGSYENSYLKCIVSSKVAMRVEVFGA